MDRRELVTTIGEIGRKLTNFETITAEEVDQMAKAAAASGRLEHRIMYANAKRVYRDGPEKPMEPPKPGTITAEAVESARFKASKSGRIEDRVKYATMKREFEHESSALS